MYDDRIPQRSRRVGQIFFFRPRRFWRQMGLIYLSIIINSLNHTCLLLGSCGTTGGVKRHHRSRWVLVHPSCSVLPTVRELNANDSGDVTWRWSNGLPPCAERMEPSRLPGGAPCCHSCWRGILVVFRAAVVRLLLPRNAPKSQNLQGSAVLSGSETPA